MCEDVYLPIAPDRKRCTQSVSCSNSAAGANWSQGYRPRRNSSRTEIIKHSLMVVFRAESPMRPFEETAEAPMVPRFEFDPQTKVSQNVSQVFRCALIVSIAAPVPLVLEV